MRYLLARWHAVFCDAQARLKAAGASVSARAPVLRGISERYRAALRLALERAKREAEQAVPELALELHTLAEYMRIVGILWELAEVATLHVDAGTAVGGGFGGGSPPLAFLKWLRGSFCQETTEEMMSHVIAGLKAPVATDDAACAAWDVVVKLTMEGEPNPAGRLLQVLTKTKYRVSEKSVVAKDYMRLAELLSNFPPLVEPGPHMAAHCTAWDSWREQALQFRDTKARDKSGVWRDGALLLNVLCGNAPGATLAFTTANQRFLELLGASADAPYNFWHYEAVVRLLYAPEVAPLATPRTRLAHILATSLANYGKPVTPAHPDGAVDEAAFFSTFLRTLRGEPTAPLPLFIKLQQPWALAHLADVLWSAGALSAAAPVLCAGWNAPTRAHLLLEHALSLPAYAPELVRAGLAYALAATPEAALAASGVSEVELRAGLGVAVPVGEHTVAVAAACMDPSHMSAAARIAKMAVLSGSVVGASEVFEAVLARMPLSDERATLQAVSLAERFNAPVIASRITDAWVSRCLDTPEGSDGQLGCALAWALSGGTLLAAVLGRLRDLVDKAIDQTIKRNGRGNAAGAVAAVDSDKNEEAAEAPLKIVDGALAVVGFDVEMLSPPQLNAETLFSRPATNALEASSEREPLVKQLLHARRLLPALANLGSADGDQLISVVAVDVAALVASSAVIGPAQSRLLRLIFSAKLHEVSTPRTDEARARVQHCWALVVARIIATEKAAAEALRALCNSDVRQDAPAGLLHDQTVGCLSVKELREFKDFAMGALAAF